MRVIGEVTYKAKTRSWKSWCSKSWKSWCSKSWKSWKSSDSC
ncbi:hypothetical protein [Modestobacter marinus]|nr:hypothetical protein [Modestobacter marinus]